MGSLVGGKGAGCTGSMCGGPESGGKEKGFGLILREMEVLTLMHRDKRVFRLADHTSALRRQGVRGGLRYLDEYASERGAE